MKKHYGCPIKATANTLAGKWKVLMVWHLAFGGLRFAELRNVLPGISEKVMIEQLRELERDGIVRRVVAQGSPPRVDYSLTVAGEALIPIMESMCDWGSSHLGVKPTLARRPVMTVG